MDRAPSTVGTLDMALLRQAQGEVAAVAIWLDPGDQRSRLEAIALELGLIWDDLEAGL